VKLYLILGTPLGAAVLTGGFGLDPKDAMQRVGIEAELALAPELVKQTSKLVKNPLLQRALNLGLSPAAAMRLARIASPVGIASLGGEALYKYGKFVKDELDRIEKMSPEEREAYNIAEQEQMGVAAADGGLIRQGFKGGGADMGAGSSKSSKSSGPAGGASSGGNYGGNKNSGPDRSKVSAQQERNNQAAVREAQAVNQKKEAQAKQSLISSINPINPIRTFFDHTNFTKTLKRVGSIPNYHQLGGYDFMSRFPNTPPSIAKSLGYGYQGLSEGIRSLNPFDNYSFQDAMTRAGEEGRLNALGVDAYGNPTNPITQQYYNLPTTLGPNFATNFYKQFNQGGRVGFADGPPDPSKRKFVKTMAGLASLPIFGKFLKPATKAIEAGAPVAEKAVTEAEKIFFNLVDAVKNKGIMDKLDRVTGGRLSGAYHEYKGAEVLEDGGSITARFKTDTGAPAEIVYIKPQKRIDPKTGKEVEYPGQFDYEAQEIGRMNPEGDVDIDAEFEIIDSLEDVKKLIDD
jgi:hypothetical protein